MHTQEKLQGNRQECSKKGSTEIDKKVRKKSRKELGKKVRRKSRKELVQKVRKNRSNEQGKSACKESIKKIGK